MQKLTYNILRDHSMVGSQTEYMDIDITLLNIKNFLLNYSYNLAMHDDDQW